VLLSSRDSVKLCDFGFSHLMSTSMMSMSHSKAHPHGVHTSASKAGTPLYKAPECWDPDRLSGPASDIWSFGQLLHELFTGRVGSHVTLSFEQLAVLHIVRKQSPAIDPALAAAHPAVAAVIEQCCRWDDRARPTSERLLGTLRGLFPLYNASIDDDS
jgi:serine/threonine protein kinase